MPLVRSAQGRLLAFCTNTVWRHHFACGRIHVCAVKSPYGTKRVISLKFSRKVLIFISLQFYNPLTHPTKKLLPSNKEHINQQKTNIQHFFNPLTFWKRYVAATPDIRNGPRRGRLKYSLMCLRIESRSTKYVVISPTVRTHVTPKPCRNMLINTKPKMRYKIENFPFKQSLKNPI